MSYTLYYNSQYWSKLCFERLKLTFWISHMWSRAALICVCRNNIGFQLLFVQDMLSPYNHSPLKWYVSWAFITCSFCQYIFHICPPSHSKIYFWCLMAKCPCTWGMEACRTSISASSFDTSPLASSVLRTISAKSLSDFSSLGTFQNVKVTEKLALCKVCCHLLLVSNLRSISGMCQVRLYFIVLTSKAYI